ncbi:hypothetical protein [Agaribacterium haliotis]|uniref:hypothetical protein n=1 Tax=Agaribacterium haliotis TaxID=2013869 RepID=UPI000BB52D49|nr:hypothetical protein [Agaribacterium haliotis]
MKIFQKIFSNSSLVYGALAFFSCAYASEVFYFPTNNQSPEQVEEEKGQCHSWAAEQSKFDPNKAPSSDELAQKMLAENPAPEMQGENRAVARGAARGAIIGSTVGRWNNNDRTQAGAAGAVAGAAATAKAADQHKQASAGAHEQKIRQQAQAQLDKQHSDFNRAMQACMETKGYNIR